MTWFSSMIPGAPGNADSIALVAQALHESATHADNIEQAVSRIPSSISTWKGHAHLDYLESQQRARSRMIHFNEGMACAANDVESYSWSVRAMHNYVENTLRPTAQELDEAFTRTPAGQRLDAYFSLLAEARTLQGEYRERYNRLKQEAEDLALSLQQALSIEPVAKKSKFAGGFFDPSRTERLSERDIDRINAELKALREGSFDLRAIAQGSIGDCYYLASLMAVMNSPRAVAPRRRHSTALQPRRNDRRLHRHGLRQARLLLLRLLHGGIGQRHIPQRRPILGGSRRHLPVRKGVFPAPPGRSQQVNLL